MQPSARPGEGNGQELAGGNGGNPAASRRIYAKRRQKVREQCGAYAKFLAQESRSDVTAYIFDDTDGLVNLEKFGTFAYCAVKNDIVRGRRQSGRWD